MGKDEGKVSSLGRNPRGNMVKIWVGWDRQPTEIRDWQYSSPPLIRPPYLPRNCGHIREVAFGEREK